MISKTPLTSSTTSTQNTSTTTFQRSSLLLRKSSQNSAREIRNSSTSTQKNNFRMQAKNWFLTFPQCNLPKSEAMRNLLQNADLSVTGAAVAQERHADGERHLHILLCLENKVRTRDPTFWDFVAGKHGNYQAARYPQKVLKYISKEDAEVEVHGTIPGDSGDSKTSKSDTVAEMILSGSSISEVTKKFPGFVLLNYAKVTTFKSIFTGIATTESLEPLRNPIEYRGENIATTVIVEWLNSNLFTSRDFKQKQLYIFGPKNFGKTSLILRLSKYLRVYSMPHSEDFYDGYADSEFDLIFLDEFRGNKTIQFLNLWLQGGLPFCYRTKGGQGMKRKNLPCIICSNYSLENCYKDENKIETLRTRLDEVMLSEPIDLENIMLDKPVTSEKDEQEDIETEDEQESQ